jgi:5-formyltetrahydrofolate cyclo-ligase
VKTEDKKDYRKKARLLLNEIDTKELEKFSFSLSANINSFLISNGIILEKTLFGFFYPIQQEPLWYLNLDLEKMSLSFPKTESDSFKMKFLKAKFDELKTNGNLLEPVSGEEVVPEVIFVPGLLFTKKGERLGRGKGFYDRYLENFKGQVVGLSFEKQIVESIPVDSHDRLCNWLITEKNIYRTF